MAKKAKNLQTTGINPEATAPPQTSVEQKLLKGQVKQMKELIYEALIEDGQIHAGRLIEGFSRHSNMLCTFDRQGYYQTSCSFKPDGSYTLSSYAGEGQLTEHLTHGPDGQLQYRHTFEYNEDGKQLRNLFYDWLGILISEHYHIYNEQGLCIEQGERHSNAENSYRLIRTYNEAGKVTEEKWIYQNGEIKDWKQKSYHANGRVATVHHLNQDGAISKTKEYDENGNAINPTRNWLFDDPAIFGYEGEWVTERDPQGNWTRMISYHGEEPALVRIRQITYYDHPSEHTDLTMTGHPEEIYKIETKTRQWQVPELNPEQLRWLHERATPDEKFNATAYYTLSYGLLASTTTLVSHYSELRALMQLLQDRFDARVVYTNASGEVTDPYHFYEVAMLFPGRPYMVVFENISEEHDKKFLVSKRIRDLHLSYQDMLQFGTILLLHPPVAHVHADEDFIAELEEAIKYCRVTRAADKPEIFTVQQAGGAYSLRSNKVRDDFEIKDLDLHYGDGFGKFHNELMQKFIQQSKGLVLFHGAPGTGKTFYIRHLLRLMAASKKVVIYMPPNMVDHLVDPGFMTFINQKVTEFSGKGQFCALLIEDAEPLLASRQEQARNQGITNLLNMTDGLLNDMLGMQIICTFNVDLKELDEALLRPGRLIARKEFKPLPVLEANLLAGRLGIATHFNRPATLSEIYALLGGNATLSHDT